MGLRGGSAARTMPARGARFLLSPPPKRDRSAPRDATLPKPPVCANRKAIYAYSIPFSRRCLCAIPRAPAPHWCPAFPEDVTVERFPKRRLRFLDEPYLTVQLDLERLQRALGALAARQSSPLPERMRTQLGLMRRQVARMRREIRNHAEQIEA